MSTTNNPSFDRSRNLFDSIPNPPFDVIHPRTKRVIARISQDNIVIRDRKEEGRIIRGINIPPFLREKFSNANVIYRDDPFFYEAFITAECWHLLRNGYKIKKNKEKKDTDI